LVLGRSGVNSTRRLPERNTLGEPCLHRPEAEKSMGAPGFELAPGPHL